MNSPSISQKSLNPVWLKAAVLGGLWASVEIIIGSFFHNLRLPFAGTILAANATILMIAFYQMWPDKGLIWRAGLIAALMKSISPSSIILGPMIGIILEALIIEFFIRYFGNNLVFLSIAGALSVSSALFHKLVSLLILYGFNIVNIYVNIFRFLAKQAGMEHADPWVLLFVVLGAYLILGFISAFAGKRIGERSLASDYQERGFRAEKLQSGNILSINTGQHFSRAFFYFHIFFFPAGLYALHHFTLFYAAVIVLIYALICIFRYKNSLRRLKKTVFWIQLFILTLLASVFWKGYGHEGSFFDTEGLLVGIEMNIRAVFVVIVFSSFGVELRNPVIRDFLFRQGFDKIYSALELSFSALPVMIEAMPRPKFFLRHPVKSFAMMMMFAREWLKVFEGSMSDIRKQM